MQLDSEVMTCEVCLRNSDLRTVVSGSPATVIAITIDGTCIEAVWLADQ